MTTPLPPELVPLAPSDPPEIEGDLWAGFGGSLAFDIGARKGENISPLARLGFTKIVACEPHKESFIDLAARFTGLSNTHITVKCRMIAVSSVAGTVDLAMVPHCIAKGELVTWGLRGMEWEPDDWSKVPLATVQATTLDQMAFAEGTPDLVVIDTEGHELMVLAGGSTLIRKGRTDFLIEFHSPSLHSGCAALLADARYDVFTLRHPHYPPGSKMWYQHGWIRALAPHRPTLGQAKEAPSD